MKSLFFTLLLFLCILFSSCVTTSDLRSNADCATVLINGPSVLSVGETAVFNAVYYDKNHKIIKNCKNITPAWNIGNRDIINLEKDLGNCIKIKAMKSGECCIQASVNNLVTSIAITVE
ncbi:MAG: hypothetical protein PHW02_08275 [bacterium]|nr:hypothetical protein [bacterium]